MSDIGRGVHTYLQTKSAVTDVSGTRGYPEVLPQKATLPAYTYSGVTATSEQDLDNGVGVAQTLLQVNCFGTTHITANNLREQIRLVMQGYRGAAGSETILCVTVGNKLDRYDPPLDGSDQGRYLRIIEFNISHREGIPTT